MCSIGLLKMIRSTCGPQIQIQMGLVFLHSPEIESLRGHELVFLSTDSALFSNRHLSFSSVSVIMSAFPSISAGHRVSAQAKLLC